MIEHMPTLGKYHNGRAGIFRGSAKLLAEYQGRFSMRLVPVLMGVFIVSCVQAQMSFLGPQVQLDAPTVVFTRGAGVHVRHDLQVQLHAGDNCLMLDVAALEADPATVRMRLLEPAGKVTVLSGNSGRQPGQMTWQVTAAEAAPARLRLTYEISHLQADVGYGLHLDPSRQRLALQADITVRNGGKHPLLNAKVVLPQGQQTTLSLQPGQSVQQKLFSLADQPYEISYLYDYTRFKDAVRTWLTLPGEPRSTSALPAGKARLYAPGPGGTPSFVADVAIPYVPAGEKLELDLGPAPEIAVVRNRLRSDQVNARTDVYRKLALFDVEEEIELELSNQRTGPATLLIREHVAGDWQLLKSSLPGEQTDSATLEFSVRLPAGATEKLTYTVKRLNVEP